MTTIHTVPIQNLTLAGARFVAAAAEAAARDAGLQMSIAITDVHGNLLLFQRMDGAPLLSATVSIGKARTSALAGAPSRVIEEAVGAGHQGLLSIGELVAVSGGMPLMSEGAVVGAIGVSGGSADQDHEIAEAGVVALDAG